MNKEAEQQHATASSVIPMIKKLRMDKTDLNISGIGTLKDETIKILTSISVTGHKHFSDIEKEKIYTISTLLDPRYISV